MGSARFSRQRLGFLIGVPVAWAVLHAELLALWHNARRSLLKSRQHLLNEAEFLLADLPLELRATLPNANANAVRPRLAVLARRSRRRRWDAPTVLRLRMLDEHRARIARLDAQEKDATRQLGLLVATSGSTLDELCGLSTRSVAELLAEVGDPRRSPRAASRASTAQHRWPPRPPKAPASRSATATTPAATGA